MNVHLVADVGNSRIKWGVRSRMGEVPAIIARASLGDDAAEWRRQLAAWKEQFPVLRENNPLVWATAGVHPERLSRLRVWIAANGDQGVTIDHYDQLPLTVDVDEPRRVGLDRLLNAVAAKSNLPSGFPALLVDVGTAVTVDWLDEKHVFRGGAIFPGLRLMSKALHDYTALLPEVQVGATVPALPGRSTAAAIEAGVFWTVFGGIEQIFARLARPISRGPHVFLTGGDADHIAAAIDEGNFMLWLAEQVRTPWPEQTLQGILLSAEALSG